MMIMKRLQEERERLFGLDRLDFSQRCGVVEKMVADWETGKGFPDAPLLQRMAELGVDVYYVLTGRMGPCNKEDSELLSCFHRCPPDSQLTILEMATKEAEKAEEIEKENKTLMSKLFSKNSEE